MTLKAVLTQSDVEQYFSTFNVKVKSAYIQKSKPIDLECLTCGNAFSIAISRWTPNPGCRSCKKKERQNENVQKAKDICKSRSLSYVSGGLTLEGPLTVKCESNHTRTVRMQDVIRNKHDCAVCAGQARDDSEIYALFESRGFTVTELKGSKAWFICPNGHSHSITIDSFKRGTGCGLCKGFHVTTEDVAKIVGCEGYTLKSEYQGTLKKLSLVCPNGHLTHTLTYAAWKIGKRCQHCSSTYVSPKEVVADFASFGITLIDEYKDYLTPMLVRCDAYNHEFYICWNTWKRSKGYCRVCEKSNGFQINKPGTLYYVRFDIDGTYYYKIGITNRTIKERFSGEVYPYKVIKQVYYSDGQLCLNDETAILRQYKTALYSGKPILKSGNSELFLLDVLELDTPKLSNIV